MKNNTPTPMKFLRNCTCRFPTQWKLANN